LALKLPSKAGCLDKGGNDRWLDLQGDDRCCYYFDGDATGELKGVFSLAFQSKVDNPKGGGLEVKVWAYPSDTEEDSMRCYTFTAPNGKVASEWRLALYFNTDEGLHECNNLRMADVTPEDAELLTASPLQKEEFTEEDPRQRSFYDLAASKSKDKAENASSGAALAEASSSVRVDDSEEEDDEEEPWCRPSEEGDPRETWTFDPTDFDQVYTLARWGIHGGVLTQPEMDRLLPAVSAGDIATDRSNRPQSTNAAAAAPHRGPVSFLARIVSCGCATSSPCCATVGSAEARKEIEKQFAIKARRLEAWIERRLGPWKKSFSHQIGTARESLTSYLNSLSLTMP